MILYFHPRSRNGGRIFRPNGPEEGKCLNTWIDEVTGWQEFPVRNGHTTQIGFVVDNKVLICSGKTGHDTNECYESDIYGDLSSASGFNAKLRKVDAKLEIKPSVQNVDVWRSNDGETERLVNVDLNEEKMSPLFNSGRAQINASKYWIAGGSIFAPVRNHDHSLLYTLELKVI